MYVRIFTGKFPIFRSRIRTTTLLVHSQNPRKYVCITYRDIETDMVVMQFQYPHIPPVHETQIRLNKLFDESAFARSTHR